MTNEMLLEIGVEELPAGFLPKAIKDMETIMAAQLAEHRIAYEKIKATATPRRLTICCEGVAEKQEDQLVEKMGPAKQVAFDENGKPSKALAGFARGQGLEIAALETVKTDKGEYFVARKKNVGVATASIMPALMTQFVQSLSFKKSMRWSDFNTRFARPIHWLLALYGGDVVSFSIENITSSNKSFGHRFMSPTAVEVKDFADYKDKLKQKFVIVDHIERREAVVKAIKDAASSVGGDVLISESLLEEVTFLAEYPTAVCGGFAIDYLQLPKDVLVTTMVSHQKYFPVVDVQGNLLPNFVTVNNTLAKDTTVVTKGNEKVIRARLKDAEFFFIEDQKKSLDARVEDLKNVVYHSQLGTSYEKVGRFRALAAYVAGCVAPALKETVDRSAFLAKADLDTQMVGEFSELQGIMGREYALLAGEKTAVANAIYEHYLPIVAGGQLPQTDEGAIVSIADKMDTIVGFFGIGLAPTGAADPYALRRQALGIINIIIDKKYHIELNELVATSVDIVAAIIQRDKHTVAKEVLEFFKARFENLMVAQGYSVDVVDAVSEIGVSDMLDTFSKMQAMSVFKTHKECEPLAIAFKRARNIIKDFKEGNVKAELFEHDEEKQLYATYLSVQETAVKLIKSGEILEALTTMASLREPIDRFFETVMVMAEGAAIRFNRQSLLAVIFALFANIADFSKIAVDTK